MRLLKLKGNKHDRTSASKTITTNRKSPKASVSGALAVGLLVLTFFTSGLQREVRREVTTAPDMELLLNMEIIENSEALEHFEVIRPLDGLEPELEG